MCRRRCRFRGSDGCCYYHMIMGKTRLVQLYKLIGAKTLTDEVRELLRPKNCGFFEPGKFENRVRTIVLQGSHVERDKRPKRMAESEARKLYQEGKNDAEIAAALEVSRQTVSKWRKRVGLQAVIHLNRMTFDEKKAMRLYKKGKTDGQIGAAVGKSAEAICKWRWRRGLPSQRKRNEKR